ncbi:hypothetical protein HYU07_07130 [Candidatus Woesearchaeota archaeon]|nr:hypothetical protein [Candidatus Woesearchaeota archaeon]
MKTNKVFFWLLFSIFLVGCYQKTSLQETQYTGKSSTPSSVNERVTTVEEIERCRTSGGIGVSGGVCIFDKKSNTAEELQQILENQKKAMLLGDLNLYLQDFSSSLDINTYASSFKQIFQLISYDYVEFSIKEFSEKDDVVTATIYQVTKMHNKETYESAVTKVDVKWIFQREDGKLKIIATTPMKVYET